MTKVITRYFDSATRAIQVRNELVQQRRFSTKIVRLYDDANGLADALTAANVDATAAKTYEKHVAKGGAVLLVNAGFKPLSVAKITREVTAFMGAANLGDIVEEVFVRDEIKPASSVLTNHPKFLSREKDPYETNHYMANWPIPLISRAKPSNNSIFPRHARMADFPIPLTDRRKPFTGSIIGRHQRMANFPIPLLSKRKPNTASMFERHARMANFPIPLTSKRKPFTGSIFGRHQRMATVPFPLLINGKTGTNSLMPGGPRMANFPISLLSGRKPNTASIFGRHARMANFPISLTSKRKPFTGSAFSRHARMADMILPLVMKRSEGGSKGFTMSGLFGLPTLIRR
ncbi:MAG: PucR family transcriptional regulator [Sedimentitalea sp.]